MKRARYIGTERARGARKLLRGEFGHVETTVDRGTQFVQTDGERWTVYADEIEIILDPGPVRLDLPSVIIIGTLFVLAMFALGVWMGAR